MPNFINNSFEQLRRGYEQMYGARGPAPAHVVRTGGPTPIFHDPAMGQPYGVQYPGGPVSDPSQLGNAPGAVAYSGSSPDFYRMTAAQGDMSTQGKGKTSSGTESGSTPTGVQNMIQQRYGTPSANYLPEVSTGLPGYATIGGDAAIGAPLRGANLDISKDPAVGQFDGDINQYATAQEQAQAEADRVRAAAQRPINVAQEQADRYSAGAPPPNFTRVPQQPNAGESWRELHAPYAGYSPDAATQPADPVTAAIHHAAAAGFHAGHRAAQQPGGYAGTPAQPYYVGPSSGGQSGQIFGVNPNPPQGYGLAPRAQLVQNPAGYQDPAAQHKFNPFGWVGDLFNNIFHRPANAPTPTTYAAPGQQAATNIGTNMVPGAPTPAAPVTNNPLYYQPYVPNVYGNPYYRNSNAGRGNVQVGPLTPVAQNQPTDPGATWRAANAPYPGYSPDAAVGAPLRGENLDISKDPAVGQGLGALAGAMGGSGGGSMVGGLSSIAQGASGYAKQFQENQPDFQIDTSKLAGPVPNPAYFVPIGLSPNTGGVAPWQS